MRIGFAVLSVVVAASIGTMHSATAADMPVKVPVYKAPAAVVAYNWSGFYAGANVGAARQRNCWFFFDAVGFSGDEGCHSNTNVVAGGQIGANWQSGNIVLGVEASGDWANLKGSNVSLLVPTFTNQTRTDAIGLFTGRVGIAWNNWLAYVKGGGAVTHNKYTAIFNPTGAFGSTTDTRWGWTAGGGIEYGFAPNWSAAVEYNYIDTGSKNEGFPSPTPCAVTIPCSDRISQRIHMATLRVNYRFAPWVLR